MFVNPRASVCGVTHHRPSEYKTAFTSDCEESRNGPFEKRSCTFQPRDKSKEATETVGDNLPSGRGMESEIQIGVTRFVPGGTTSVSQDLRKQIREIALRTPLGCAPKQDRLYAPCLPHCFRTHHATSRDGVEALQSMAAQELRSVRCIFSGNSHRVPWGSKTETGQSPADARVPNPAGL